MNNIEQTTKILNEDKRSQLVQSGKQGAYYKTDRSKGRNRFERRVKSKVANNTKSFNQIDMNKLFRDGILTVNVNVRGETDDYQVKISFGRFLDIVQRYAKKFGKVDLRTITLAVLDGFNQDDVFIHCSCDDWRYRMAYFCTRKQLNSGEPENRPSDITNPNDDLGHGCKHVMLVIANNNWLKTVARVIYNYILYMKEHREDLYARIIYPAIYGKKYEDEYQLPLEDEDNLADDSDTISRASQAGIERGRFQKGNQSGVQFARKQDSENDDQISRQLLTRL